MKRFLFFLIVFGLVFAFSTPTYSGKVTSPLFVSANVKPVCTVSISHLDFGEYIPATGNHAEGNVNVTCPKKTRYKITLDAGKNSKGHLRRMSDGHGNYLSYKVWMKNSHHKKEWGDCDFDNTFSAGLSLGAKSEGKSRDHKVHGFVLPYRRGHHDKKPSSDVPPAGLYTDEILVTVHY